MSENKGLLFALLLLAGFILPPVFIWATLMPLYTRFLNFGSTLTSTGQLCGLIGFSLFALAFLFSARVKLFDSIFAGLNNVYIRHHHIGAIAFMFLMVHPLALAVARISISVNVAANFFLSSFTDNTILWGNLGLLLMMGLLIVTLYIKLRYHIWKMSHKFLAVAFTLGFIHMMVIVSDVTQSLALKIYLVVLGIIAFVCIAYRVLFARIVVRHYIYKVSAIEQLNSYTTQIKMVPQITEMKYAAGQYAFFTFGSEPVSREQHPFSFSSAPQEKELAVIVKNLGDYTEKMKNIRVGSRVVVEGPYGAYFMGAPEKQVWIPGGIGVTPFLSKAGALGENEDVVMFYCANNKEEAVCLDGLELLARNNSRFKLYTWYSEQQGRITAAKIKGLVPDFESRDYYLCGPVPMMRSLREQLVALGIKNEKIHSEEFALI